MQRAAKQLQESARANGPRRYYQAADLIDVALESAGYAAHEIEIADADTSEKDG